MLSRSALGPVPIYTSRSALVRERRVPVIVEVDCDVRTWSTSIGGAYAQIAFLVKDT